MLKEFREFIARGNVLDLAVAVVLGAAFNQIVTSLVDNIIMPLVGIVLGGIDFSSLSVTVGSAVLQYGLFIQAIINFILVAFALFLIVKAYNRLRRKQVEEPEEKEELPQDVVLLTEIRDLLRDGGSADPTLRRTTRL